MELGNSHVPDDLAADVVGLLYPGRSGGCRRLRLSGFILAFVDCGLQDSQEKQSTRPGVLAGRFQRPVFEHQNAIHSRGDRMIVRHDDQAGL